MRTPLALLLLGTLPLAAEVRVWTDSQNRQVMAEMVKIEATVVTLKLKDGREIPYPLEKLSQADREYAEGKREELTKIPTGPDEGEEEEEQPGKPLNFNAPWPERISFSEDPEVDIIEELPDEKRFVYESANYRYVCDVRLTKSVVKGFALMFETTNLYCATVPLALNGGSPKNGKHQILLFQKIEDYIRNGGLPGSAGVFNGNTRQILVPLDSVGVRPLGSGYTVDREKSNSTLSHELTHQLTPPVYFTEETVGWFSEGLAEYISSTPYRHRAYTVRNATDDFIKQVTAYGPEGKGGSALGTNLVLPPLRDFMTLPYENFLGEGRLNYGASLLLVTYFFHMDGAGDGARIKAFLKALREKKTGDDAFAVLLDGRTFKDLEAEIIQAWSRKGVKFIFVKRR